MQEQFIRQAKSIPSNPVVVMSSSGTPNWKRDKCEGVKSYTLTPSDIALLRAYNSSINSMELITTQKNKGIIQEWGANMHTLMSRYEKSGIQAFEHKGCVVGFIAQLCTYDLKML
jgi:hypothetical protein